MLDFLVPLLPMLLVVACGVVVFAFLPPERRTASGFFLVLIALGGVGLASLPHMDPCLRAAGWVPMAIWLVWLIGRH